MDIRKKILKIAEKILADVHFSTQQEFDEYLKNHPNYREDTKFYVNGVQVKAPPKQKKNNIADNYLKKIEENEKMVYDSEYDQYLTMDEVKKEYENLKESGETEAENFDDYLENITGKNGSCKIVKKTR